MGFFKTREEKLAALYKELEKLREKRGEINKNLRILDMQFDRQAHKGVSSEVDLKSLERISKTKMKFDDDLMAIIKKEEELVTKIIKWKKKTNLE